MHKPITTLMSLVALAACSGGPPATCPGDAAGSACVELRIASPDVELVMGPQGGFHIDAGVAFGGASPEGLIVEYEARDVENATVYGSMRLSITPSLLGRDGTLYLRSGDRIVLNIVSSDQILGRSIDVTVRLERDGVELGRDQARVAVVDAS